MSDIEGVIDAWQEGYAKDRLLNPDTPIETFIDFVPPAKKDMAIYQFHPDDLPCHIKSSHAWRFEVRDPRRKSL